MVIHVIIGLSHVSSVNVVGQSFVIFKTREVAELVVTKLEEGCLLLSNGRYVRNLNHSAVLVFIVFSFYFFDGHSYESESIYLFGCCN